MDNEHQQRNLLTSQLEPPTALTEHIATSAVSTHIVHPEPEPHDSEDDAINLMELWQVLVKRRWTVLTFFLIVVTAVMTATFLMTPIYRSSITLQIEREAAKVVDFQGVTPIESPNDRDFYQTQYELLKSRSLAQRVIEEVGLSDNPTFVSALQPVFWKRFTAWAGENKSETQGEREIPPDLITLFLDKLTVEPVRNSRLVTLHYDSPNAELATRVVNALAQAFINVNLERRFDASSYAKKFLQERLQQIKAKLEDSERELVSFAREQEIVNVDDKQTVNSLKLQEINSALAKAEQERMMSEAAYAQMEAAKTQGLTRILESPVIQQLKETRAKLEAEYQDGLKLYKPAYPKMIQLRGQIAEVQQQIDDEVDNIRSAIKADYEAAKAREDLLHARLAELKSEVIGLQDRSIEYNILKREVDTNRQLYEGLLQRYKEVGVAGGVGTNNISIVDKAEVPRHPFKPNMRINSLLAIFLGVFGGIGLAFVFERLDDTLKQPEELERQLGIPVLGVIPAVKEGRGNGRDRAPLALAVQEDPRSAFAEAYRSVRTALQFSTPEGAPKVLLVTSSAAAEGKSTTALSIAIHFAQTGKKVLLIDTDLRNPSLHRALAMDNGQGLTNHLAGESKPVEITRPTVVPNLFVIPTGPLPPNPAELLSSAKMVAFLSLAAEKFEQVILDASPVLGLADALILGNLAHGTVLVVEAGSTRRAYAQGALKRLRTAKTRILGGVLTKLDARNHGYGYYYSDYYYYNDSAEPKKRLLT